MVGIRGGRPNGWWKIRFFRRRCPVIGVFIPGTDEVENKNVGRNPFGRAQPTTKFNIRTRLPVSDLQRRSAAAVSITAVPGIGYDRNGNMDRRRRS